MTVLIQIVNTQTADGEMQEITETVLGEYVRSGDEFTLTYNSKEPIGGKTVVAFSGGDFISVIRTESGFDTEMYFEKGKTRPAVYNTPYGEILIETKTGSVSSLVEENGGFIEFEYELLSGGELQSQNRMKISFSEEKDVKISQDC
ncbi:MAG: DUF1934 domain-containing protein [Clostridiales bacterium]|nr:DUF1934 domain-containing protein [Clostridia bacterium]MCR4564383.1 DUF1934 domain-containing protein [Clostridiales bacterium]